MAKKQLYTVAEYAAKEGVSSTTVYNWIKSGKLTVKQIGKIKLIEE